MSIVNISLNRDQVPEPPHSEHSYGDTLRWLLMVMDPFDPDMKIIAFALSQWLSGLGQIDDDLLGVCESIHGKIDMMFDRGELLCQKVSPPPFGARTKSRPTSLRAVRSARRGGGNADG